MPKVTSSFRDELLKDLRDLAYATDYIAACTVDGDVAIAVRDVIDSAKLAERERCEKIVLDHPAAEPSELAEIIRSAADPDTGEKL